MTEVENKTVFISYRHNVSAFIAQSIFLDLRAHSYDVFKDEDSIDAGQWERVIMGQIAARTHFLIVLTPGTLDRCIDPNDMLRKEIERAMELKRNIVLIFVNEFSFEKTKEFLAGKLESLPTYNGFNLYYDYFDGAMARLRDRFLNGPVHVDIDPAPPADEQVIEQKIEAASAELESTKQQLSAEQYFQRALNRSDDDLEGQISDYTGAIKLDPTYAAAYNNRGIAHRNRGDLQGALEDYSHAINLDPKNAGIYINRGILLVHRKDLAGAIADYDMAILVNPKEPLAYFARGIAREMCQDLEGAITDLTQAVMLNPMDAEVYLYRGNIRVRMGEIREAIKVYSIAIGLNANYASAYNKRGAARYADGDIEGASEDYRRYFELDSGQYIGN